MYRMDDVEFDSGFPRRIETALQYILFENELISNPFLSVRTSEITFSLTGKSAVVEYRF